MEKGDKVKVIGNLHPLHNVNEEIIYHDMPLGAEAKVFSKFGPNIDGRQAVVVELEPVNGKTEAMQIIYESDLKLIEDESKN